jgi:hypothetical protein
MRQRLHQEVRRSHARLDRPEGMLDRLAPLTHGLRVLVKPTLHGFKHMLVLPAGDPRCSPVVQWLLIGQARHAVVQ